MKRSYKHLSCILFAFAVVPGAYAQQAESKPVLQAEHTVRIAVGQTTSEFTIEASQAGKATILVSGLSVGGHVEVQLNGKEPRSVELLSTKGLQQGKADSALVTALLEAGKNRLTVAEHPGAQVVRVEGTNLWFGTTSEAKGHPQFSIDVNRLKNKVGYPITAYFGPGWKPFFWFSGKFDKYHADSYTQEVIDVSGSSGPREATLFYTARHPPRNLIMPTRITLIRHATAETSTLRVHQTIRAYGDPTWGDNLEFLHLVINPRYGHDWGDGVPDFVWYRTQREDAPDTLPGSHTTLARMDDNTLRCYPYPASTSDPRKTALSGPHHVKAAVAMEAVNTIGGWFTKSGVGAIGLVFHRYKASFRDDLTPLHSHCGDGADTHVYLFWGDLFQPLGMKAGDQLDIEYSLTMLPSEPLHTDIEDINEADVFFFGKEKEQKSQIVQWLGTKQAIGLQRSDSSIILLGIGTKPGRVKVPEPTQAAAKRVFRMFDIGRHRNVKKLEIVDGTVEVHPRWITVVDCGSARQGPRK